MYVFSSGSLTFQNFNTESAECLKCKLIWKDIKVICEDIKSEVAK